MIDGMGFLDWNGDGRIDPVDIGVSMAVAPVDEAEAPPRRRWIDRLREAFDRGRAPKPPEPPKRIALVGCAKQKQDHPCMARDLYSPSTLFSLSYEYARRNADRVYIISAKHGLVPDGAVIAPYDETLNDMSVGARRAWADRVMAQLARMCDIERDRFIILAGRRYYEYLTPRLPNATLPLGNLPLGSRISYLQRCLNADAGKPPQPVGARPAPRAVPPARPAQKSELKLEAGDLVTHVKFGDGRVLSVHDEGLHAWVEVDFGRVGVKKLMLRLVEGNHLLKRKP